jgi:hypothetical protein
LLLQVVGLERKYLDLVEHLVLKAPTYPHYNPTFAQLAQAQVAIYRHHQELALALAQQAVVHQMPLTLAVV